MARTVGTVGTMGTRAGEKKGGWGRGIRGDAVAGSGRGTHRLVRLVVAEILLVPHDVFAFGRFPAARAGLDFGHVVPARLPVRGPRDAGARVAGVVSPRVADRARSEDHASFVDRREGRRRRPGVRVGPVARTRRARLRVHWAPNPAATAPRGILQPTRDGSSRGIGERRVAGSTDAADESAKNVTNFLECDTKRTGVSGAVTLSPLVPRRLPPVPPPSPRRSPPPA